MKGRCEWSVPYLRRANGVVPNASSPLSCVVFVAAHAGSRCLDRPPFTRRLYMPYFPPRTLSSLAPHIACGRSATLCPSTDRLSRTLARQALLSLLSKLSGRASPTGGASLPDKMGVQQHAIRSVMKLEDDSHVSYSIFWVCAIKATCQGPRGGRFVTHRRAVEMRPG